MLCGRGAGAEGDSSGHRHAARMHILCLKLMKMPASKPGIVWLPETAVAVAGCLICIGKLPTCYCPVGTTKIPSLCQAVASMSSIPAV